mgnify:CR=1 FL=1
MVPTPLSHPGANVPIMTELPDLATATRDAARWELEFALDPAASACRYATALNTLAAIQEGNGMPDAAVTSWFKAAQALAHPGVDAGEDVTELECTVLFNLIPALLRQDDPERALTFADRLIDLEAGPHGEPGSRGIAADYKAQCLRALGRSAEELDARVDALAQFALTEDPESVPQFSEIATNRAAQRIGQILEAEN